MHGITHPCKQDIIKELKEGIPSSVLSKKYNVAMSTITTWIKENPDIKTKFSFRNKRISVMRKVNVAEARIVDKISEYIVCDISDSEWEELQAEIQRELIGVATFEGDDPDGTLCQGCLFCP